MDKKEFYKISKRQNQFLADMEELFDNFKKKKLPKKEAECIVNLYSRLQLMERKVFSAIMGGEIRNFDEDSVKKFLSLCKQHIKELRRIGDNFRKKKISEKKFNSMLKIYKKLDGMIARKILKTLEGGFGDDQIKKLYDEIKELRIKNGLKA